MHSSYSVAAIAAMMAGYTSAQTNAGPTVSLFLPVQATNLGASIITAAPSSTVYAISCYADPNQCPASCPLESTVVVTEGQSTLAYTWTDGNRASVASTGAPLQNPVTTVNCELYGSSSAVCTGILGANTTSTTTLSQITYVPVAITAGGSNMTNMTITSSSPSGTGAAASGASATGSSSSGAAQSSSGAMAKAVVGYGAGIVAGLGALAML